MGAIAAALPQGVEALIATRGRRYRELGLKGQQLSEKAWRELIQKEPRLLRRPILWNGEAAVVGFDKATYEELFGR